MWRTLAKIRNSLEICCKLQKSEIRKKNLLNTVPSSIQCYSLCSFGHCNAECSSRQRSNRHKSKQQNPYFQLHTDWLDAVGWSGVVLLSWFITQPYRVCKLSRNLHEKNVYYKPYCHNSSLAQLSFFQFLSKAVISSANNHVQHVLPIVRAVKPTALSTEAEFEENLLKGCEKLQKAHNIVNSSLMNFLGTECMQNEQHDDAFAYFSEAANNDNTAAIFNLGICYEMGLGTAQSFQKAAELYKKAADLGHATAMYNLGVFRVHGWGGVEANIDEARQLFTRAAHLGQVDAQNALSQGNCECEPPHQQDDDSPIFVGPSKEELQCNDATQLWFNVLNIHLNSYTCSDDNGEDSLSADSGINMSPSSEVTFILGK